MRGLGASTSACSSAGARGSAAGRARVRLPALQATKKNKGGPGPASPPPPPPEAGTSSPTPSTTTKKEEGSKPKARKPPAGSRSVPTTTQDTAWSAEVDALGRDHLAALGKAQDYNINVTHGPSEGGVSRSQFEKRT